VNEKSFFEENGYCVFNNIFTKDEILDFKVALNSLIDLLLKKALSKHDYNQLKFTTDSLLDQGIPLLDKINPSYIPYIQRVISRSPEFLVLSSNKKASTIVKDLLEVPKNQALYLTSNGVVFTSPSSQTRNASKFETEWHLYTFYTMPKSKFIQLWAPLYHDSSHEIGTLKFAAMSHKKDPLQFNQKFDPNKGYNNQYYIEAKDIEGFDKVSIPVTLGQLLVFDGRTVHSSGLNHSSKVRCTLLSLCHDIANEDFEPLKVLYKYGYTPEQWYQDTYQDELSKEHLHDHSTEKTPDGGV